MEVTNPIYKGRYLRFALFAGCLVFALAYANRTTFPFPWNDEARFYLPAFWWAEHLSLAPTNLHAPKGIFWVPDGFTLWLGLALRLFGKTIRVARLTCECTVSLGVVLFALGFRELAGSWLGGALATLLLLTPPVVFAANMVRMEAPLFLLLSIALLLHLHKHFLAARRLTPGCKLVAVHPALGLATAAYVVVCLTPLKRDTNRASVTILDWLLFAVVAISISAELFRILHHIDLFRAHMAYQLHRKTRVPLRSKLLKPQAMILLTSCLTVAVLLWRRRVQPALGSVWEVLPIAAVALGVLIYAVAGAEMTYNIYSLSTGPRVLPPLPRLLQKSSLPLDRTLAHESP